MPVERRLRTPGECSIYYLALAYSTRRTAPLYSGATGAVESGGVHVVGQLLPTANG